jgi:hypothetical protein
MSSENQKPTSQDDTQRDKNLAAEQRPVPSPAEGDRKTVEEDLAEKSKDA